MGYLLNFKVLSIKPGNFKGAYGNITVKLFLIQMR